jgi:uncharacterized protein (TIGR02265 family)
VRSGPPPAPTPPTADTEAQLQPEVVFRQAVDGLFLVGLSRLRTPDFDARLRLLGIDLRRPLLPAYPRETWTHALRFAAEALWPERSLEDAHDALGRCLIEGYIRTPIGGAVARILRLLSPRRVLALYERSLRSGCNYNRTRVTELGPTEVLFWVNEPIIHPAYGRAMLQATLELAGTRGVQVQVHLQDETGRTFHVRWTP